jgi:hypothetical protein
VDARYDEAKTHQPNLSVMVIYLFCFYFWLNFFEKKRRIKGILFSGFIFVV